jgi:hypothetical protein
MKQQFVLGGNNQDSEIPLNGKTFYVFIIASGGSTIFLRWAKNYYNQ